MKREAKTAMVAPGLGRQWEAWLVSDATGSKVEALVVGTSKPEAKRLARDWNRRNEGFGGSQA